MYVYSPLDRFWFVAGLPLADVVRWQQDFGSDPARVIAQKSLTKFETLSVLSDRQNGPSHLFNTKVRLIHTANAE